MLISAELKEFGCVLRVYIFFGSSLGKTNDAKLQPYPIIETDFLKTHPE